MYKSVNYFYSCTNMAVISTLIVNTIVEIRHHLAYAYYEHYLITEEKALNWLKLRTIEIECIAPLTNPATDPLDFTKTNRLTGYIKKKLNDASQNSRVFTSIIIPDFSKQTTLEIQRTEVIENFNVMKYQKPFLSFLVPKYFKNEEDFNLKIKDLDLRMDLELIKPLMGSGTAFMTLESLYSISQLERQLK